MKSERLDEKQKRSLLDANKKTLPILVDLTIWRGEYVSYSMWLEAEKIRERTNYSH